ncbi:MotA/TolQ/ExbB proton channel family protein [Elusimicrobiota bacterium]
MEINLADVIRSSYVMIILLICSVFVFIFALERFWFLHKCSVDADSFMKKLKTQVTNKSYEEAIRMCEQKDKPLFNVIKIGIMNRSLKKEDIEELMESARLIERSRMEKFIQFLGTMGAIAPLMGLYGTVTGLVRAFSDLALSGSAGPSVVAAGISEALYTTVGGLALAMPTVMLFNYFNGQIRRINTDIEIHSKRLLVWISESEKSS